MCIAYYDPLNLCVFALVSEVVIYGLVQGSNKKEFVHLNSCKVDASNDFIPTWLEVGQHKVSNKVIVCLAVQQTRMNKQEQYDNYLLVIEFDQNNHYKT